MLHSTSEISVTEKFAEIVIGEVLRFLEPVEEVGVELMSTKDRARIASKPVRLVADPGLKRAPGAFFNTLASSTHSGE